MKCIKLTETLNERGFTLIELLVVIVIIGILSTLGIGAFSDSQAKARDAKRTEDLRKIQNYLELYYHDNGKYPPSDNSTSADSSCTPPVAGYGVYNGKYSKSTDSQSANPWITALTPYVKQLPVDPVNNGMGPYLKSPTKGYTYFYGAVTCDGQYYSLIARLENTNDPIRCEKKQYYYGVGNAWSCGNLATGNGSSYSRYLIDFGNRN